LAPEADPGDREALLLLIAQLVEPSLIHVVNSVAGWGMMESTPANMIPPSRLVASVFSLPRDAATGAMGGFGPHALLRALGRLDDLISDNRLFAVEAPVQLGIGNRRRMFHVVPNASRLDGIISLSRALRLAEERGGLGRAASRMRVAWAGRLDTEKRLDLLVEAADRLRAFCDIDVYGVEVLGGGPFVSALADSPNVRLRGAFESPLEWDSPELAHAFLFTSAWEGMPNVLLEAAYLGMPIVATNVGGVGDLITPETGFLISAEQGGEAYATAIRALWGSPSVGKEKATALVRKVFEHHSAEGMSKALFEVPSYRRLLDRALMDRATTSFGTDGAPRR
jgi:glycosyltransferase involved in cell wall biosynthesis